ncbi:MAG TPA: hypothetical protein VIK04_20775 [Solirubrobacteraceae bacterium]
MSQLHVAPEQVVQSAGRLSRISAEIGEVHGQVGARAGAAAGTRADATVQGSFNRWATALPQFAQAADRLLVAMAIAGAGYRLADDVVGEACAPPGGGPH